MYPVIIPRAESCPTCYQSAVQPRIMKVQQGTKVVTEAHWCCPRCSNRFKIGTVNTEEREKK